MNEEEGKPLDVLVLAAGLGTRMKSDLAKVLHRLDGRPLINHVCRTAGTLGPDKIIVIIGHQGEQVRSVVDSEFGDENIDYVVQQQQLGTGDAVNSAREILAGRISTTLVLSGDVPMIRPETLEGLVQSHWSANGSGAACTVLTVRLNDPTGYGRVIRDSTGGFEQIVEQKDATDEQRLVTEINAGIYCFDTRKLFEALTKVQNNNAQGEYYLTDVPSLLLEAGEKVNIFQHSDPHEIEGVNNRVQLADLEALLNRRTISRMMLEHGVSFIDPNTTYISELAAIGRDTVVYPNVFIEGATVIGENCTIRPGTRITNAVIGSGVEILENCVITDSDIAAGCSIGPMAHLRGHAVVLEKAKIGNFVELKKTVLGPGSKASHLTYLGDATIGEDTNIGAGTITCNYDGKNKNPTTIGSKVKIGSDTMLVAPVTVGDNSMTAAGSVVIDDVPASTLVAGVPARVKKTFESLSEGAS